MATHGKQLPGMVGVGLLAFDRSQPRLNIGSIPTTSTRLIPSYSARSISMQMRRNLILTGHVVARHEVSTNLVEPFEVLQHQSAGGLRVLRLVLKGTAEKCGAFTSSAGKAAVGRQNIWETGDGLLLFCQISSNMSHHFMLKETLDKLWSLRQRKAKRTNSCWKFQY